jgi:uncharacterized membrane protein (DUF373 family)
MVPFLNGCISFIAFITALSLVMYMLVSFISGMFDLSLLMYDTVFLDPAERQSIFNVLNSDFLHNIAVLLILMKAYRILVEYMRFHHINIKFMVEIGIITVVLELLFNSQQYAEDMRIVMVAMAVAFLAIYAFRYDTLMKATKDAEKEYGKSAKKK